MQIVPWAWLAFCVVAVTAKSADQPHIIFILADDMGWNDVSFHGSDEIPTPNIDALAYDGVILNQHYVQAICTPSRAALMSGRYPIRTGMQGYPIGPAEPRALPQMKILPQYLKDLNYATHCVGKWHLGFHKFEHAPLRRGFDSFFGYSNGFIGYYDHILQVRGAQGMQNGYDMRRNWTTAWDVAGQYATDLFADEAVRIIQSHNPQQPLFMYLAHLAAHSGNAATLLEAPQSVINSFGHIQDPSRRVYAAIMSKLDESVGKVVEALHKKDMLRNSIIVFLADNGAPTISTDYPNWGSNWPFRGVKETLWEGGVRGAGLIWSPAIQKSARVSNQLMHITDWLPTLVSAAGGDGSSLEPEIDGIDQWKTIVEDIPTRRKEILINIDETTRLAAYRFGKWKLVTGTAKEGGLYDGYFGSSGRDDPYPPVDAARVRASASARCLAEVRGAEVLRPQQVDALRGAAAVACARALSDCNPSSDADVCLFDLVNDPCETRNLARVFPSLVFHLYSKLSLYGSELVPQGNRLRDYDSADPRRFNNTWSYWADCLRQDAAHECNATPDATRPQLVE